MKNLKLILIVVCVLFSSCLKNGDELKTELAKVVAKQYTGEINATAIGFGTSASGEATTSIHVIHENAKFNVVFKCQHGVCFTINNDSIYSKLNEGDTVVILYYEKLNKKGKVKGFDFIDANKYKHH